MKLIQDLGIKISGKNKIKIGLYLCDCGNEFITRHEYIKSGHTKSCGCLHKKRASETSIKHGHTRTRIYRIWCHMKERCYTSSCKSYCNYGDRGIIVCNSWKNDFKSFYDWAINSGYKENLTIDRINNDGNYEPSNCRWTDLSTQSSNTRVIRKTNTSGYRGVSKIKYNKWRAVITSKGNHIHLGCFNTAEEAGYAYDKYIFENKLEHNSNGLYRESKPIEFKCFKVGE